MGKSSRVRTLKMLFFVNIFILKSDCWTNNFYGTLLISRDYLKNKLWYIKP